MSSPPFGPPCQHEFPSSICFHQHLNTCIYASAKANAYSYRCVDVVVDVVHDEDDGDDKQEVCYIIIVYYFTVGVMS